jgi:uncharacterized protein (TIGR03435 family)
LLAVVGLLAAAMLPPPVVGAQVGPDAGPTFDVSSVKPNTLGGPANNWELSPGHHNFRNSQVRALIRAAWDDNGLRIEGAPDWIVTERFDVVGKYPADTPPDAIRLMLRQLLRDRFKLAVHVETRQLPIYALSVAREDGVLGPHLQPGLPECVPPWPGRTTPPAHCGRGVDSGFVQLGAQDMTEFAQLLSEMQVAGRPVRDRTGLTGRFKIDLVFAPDAGARPTLNAGSPAPAPETAPSIFTALREQLGLKLEPARDDLSILIVDHIERPAPD